MQIFARQRNNATIFDVSGGCLKPTFVFARRGGMTRELRLTGGQVLVAMVTGICLVGPLLWGAVKYWLFAP